MSNKRRAGLFLPQASGSYQAFIPAPLPPNPALVWDTRLLNTLLEAERVLGRLEGITQLLPNHDLLVLMYIRAEAVLSSQIEGTQASLDDVLKAEANLADPEIPDDVSEVINYISAMNHGLERQNELPLSLRLIRELHQHLMDGVRGSGRDPGEFRRTQNWIGPAGGCIPAQAGKG
jgi:Fic family protein